jgi:hypothetical protein
MTKEEATEQTIYYKNEDISNETDSGMVTFICTPV